MNFDYRLELRGCLLKLISGLTSVFHFGLYFINPKFTAYFGTYGLIYMCVLFDSLEVWSHGVRVDVLHSEGLVLHSYPCPVSVYHSTRYALHAYIKLIQKLDNYIVELSKLI